MHLTLPLPIALPIAILSGAIGRRFAGGLLSQWIGKDLGDIPVRLLWAFFVAGTGALAGGGLVVCGLLAGGIFMGATVGYFGAMRPGATRPYMLDFLLLLAHGAIGVGFLEIAFWYAHGFRLEDGLLLLAAAFVCPIAYTLAQAFPLNIPVLGCLKVDSPPTAELLYGACVSCAVTLALSL